MNELMEVAPQKIGDETVQAVNARDLHEFLEVGTAFKDWINRRIQEYSFIDGQDFCSILSESSGGRPSKEYVISLIMAKELAMVERNSKGKQAREYFIECERRYRSQAAIPDFSDPAYVVQLAQKWLAEKERADYFERTKTQIGSHREATAMATASRAVRRANSAEKRLDTALDIIGYGKEWVQVKGIGWLKYYFDLNKPGAYSQIGKAIKKFSADFGYEVRNIEDIKYGSACLFSREAVDKFREHLEEAPLLLMNYRGGASGTLTAAL